MKCEDCPYYWADTQEYLGNDGEWHLCEVGRKYCHYKDNDGYAPCEIEDSYDEPEEHDWFEAYEEDE